MRDNVQTRGFRSAGTAYEAVAGPAAADREGIPVEWIGAAYMLACVELMRDQAPGYQIIDLGAQGGNPIHASPLVRRVAYDALPWAF
jgi:hypothetical protein